MLSLALFGGGIGLPEILVIIGALLLLFGATQIPKLARSIGEGLKEFKKSVKEAKELDDNEDNTESDSKDKSDSKKNDRKL